MPTYQYECDACSHTFEILQSYRDKKKRKCPECGKPKLYRLIGTGGGVIFKGTGFYETDYKKKNSGKPTESEKKEKSTETKAEEKTAAKDSKKENRVSQADA